MYAAGILFIMCSTTVSAGQPLEGAYALPNGEILVLSRFDGALRFFMQNGRTGSLVNVNEGAFVGSEPGLGISEPTHTLLAKDAKIVFNWKGEDRLLTPIPLAQTDYLFNSGGLELQGRLVTPADGNFQGVVILVHGSEQYSALDNNYFPDLLAANGLAAFIYDKRGTGSSDGGYTDEITILSRDVIAATDFVSTGLPELEGQAIMLAGFSQGGWVAPLAAAQSDKVAAVLIAYGPAVSVSEEDRWGYAYWLRREGYPATDLAKADQMFDLLTDMRRRGTPDRWDELQPLLDANQDEKWYREGLSGTDSSLSALTDSVLPHTLMYWWTSLFGLDKFVDYDPADALEKLAVPSYWLFAGEDASMPTEASVVNLQALAYSGKPVSYKIYPEASHGMALFEPGRGRERQFVAYHPDYYSDMIEWLQAQAAQKMPEW